MPWYKISVLLPTGGRTKKVTHESLGRNLSPSTNEWKNEPSHSRVSCSKFKSTYLLLERRTKPQQVSWYKILVLLPIGGRMNQVTYGCHGGSLKSYYRLVKGLTKPPKRALIQNLCPSTYGWKDEPSCLQVTWYKI